MDFCDGDDLFFERLMRSSPGGIPEPDEGKSCRDCAYYSDSGHMCTITLCPYRIFESEVNENSGKG